MDWLKIINTTANVANLGQSISQTEQLEQLRQMGAEQALIQAITKELRDQIFEYNQASEDLLNGADEEKKQAAAGMRLLELRLENSVIKPSVFSDLQDKEYVAKVIKNITENRKQLIGLFNLEEQQEIMDIADDAYRLPELNYHINFHNDHIEYLDAKAVYDAGKNRNGCLFWIPYLFAIFIVAVFSGGFTLIGIALIPAIQDTALVFFGPIIVGGIGIYVFVRLLKVANLAPDWGKAMKAKRQMDSIDAKGYSHDQYTTIAQKINSDFETIKSDRDKINSKLNAFWSGKPPS